MPTSLLREVLQPGRCSTVSRIVGSEDPSPASPMPPLCSPDRVMCDTAVPELFTPVLGWQRTLPAWGNYSRKVEFGGGRKEIGSCFPLPPEQGRNDGEGSIAAPMFLNDCHLENRRRQSQAEYSVGHWTPIFQPCSWESSARGMAERGGRQLSTRQELKLFSRGVREPEGESLLVQAGERG